MYLICIFIIRFIHSIHINPSFLICLCFNMVSFRGQKKLGPRPDRSPGFNSKFPTGIPTPFICGVPPGLDGIGWNAKPSKPDHV